ncbi:MAG TPA: hypothetical protein VJ673_02690 [Aromatoleum sp.]|uniref:hypothetical protein n=1 Tax=Aromatoleum sp. TaxID=2307007 RepID=UPI002B49B218|nr:hypothetical protein [Aromatoleum sp.]HJV24560.1 hypothetical protein [Aromatoleum sp.]
MNAENVKGLALLVGLLGAGYVAWKAYDATAGAVSSIGSALNGAYDAVTEVLSDVGDGISSAAAVVTQSTPARVIVANVMKPPVPVGGSSVQIPFVEDLPEGSYQAANMFWSMHPNEVFYD